MMPDISHIHPIPKKHVRFGAEDFHQDPAPTFDEFDQGGQTVPGTSCRGPFQVSSGDDSMMNSLGDETKAFTAWW